MNKRRKVINMNHFSITPKEWEENKIIIRQEFNNLVKKFVNSGHNIEKAERKALLFQVKEYIEKMESIKC